MNPDGGEVTFPAMPLLGKRILHFVLDENKSTNTSVKARAACTRRCRSQRLPLGIPSKTHSQNYQFIRKDKSLIP